MPFRSLAAMALAALVCGVSSGCHFEWQATAQCTKCGEVHEIIGDFDCDKHDAITNAQTKCQVFGGTPVSTTADSEIVLGPSCADSRTSLETSAHDAVQHFAQRIGLIDPPKVDIPPGSVTCSKVDLKVTVTHAYGHKDCPTAKEVQVQYYKKKEIGSDYVTLKATIDVGQSYDFICVDAKVDAGDVINSVWVGMQSHCDCSIDDGCHISNAFNNLPTNGNYLDVFFDLQRFEMGGQMVPQPGRASGLTTAVQHELVPIPDPMFTPSSR